MGYDKKMKGYSGEYSSELHKRLQGEFDSAGKSIMDVQDAAGYANKESKEVVGKKIGQKSSAAMVAEASDFTKYAHKSCLEVLGKKVKG